MMKHERFNYLATTLFHPLAVVPIDFHEETATTISVVHKKGQPDLSASTGSIAAARRAG